MPQNALKRAFIVDSWGMKDVIGHLGSEYRAFGSPPLIDGTSELTKQLRDGLGGFGAYRSGWTQDSTPRRP